MVVKTKLTQKEQKLNELVSSIQAKVDKLRKARNRKEPQNHRHNFHWERYN